LPINVPPQDERAQGMPGAQRHPQFRVEIKKTTRR
jgi:hypothetical protein